MTYTEKAVSLVKRGNNGTALVSADYKLMRHWSENDLEYWDLFVKFLKALPSSRKFRVWRRKLSYYHKTFLWPRNGASGSIPVICISKDLDLPSACYSLLYELTTLRTSKTAENIYDASWGIAFAYYIRAFKEFNCVAARVGKGRSLFILGSDDLYNSRPILK